MIFSGNRAHTAQKTDYINLNTLERVELEKVCAYKCLGIWVNEKISLNFRTQQ